MPAPPITSPREQRAAAGLIAQYVRELAAQAVPVTPRPAGAAA